MATGYGNININTYNAEVKEFWLFVTLTTLFSATTRPDGITKKGITRFRG
jgi:hypothetical protein